MSSKQNRDDPSVLYNFEIEDNLYSQLKINKPGFIGFDNQNQQLFYSNREIRDKKQDSMLVCSIQITKDCFKCILNRFEYGTTLIIEKYDWLVIKDTDLKQLRKNDINGFGFRLREGDVLRLGKLCFKIRELSNNTKQTMRSKDKEKDKDNNNNNEIAIQSSPIQDTDPKHVLTLQNNVLLGYSLAKTQGITCRICLSPDDTYKNPFINVCKCIGSVKYIHLDCLRDWFSSKIITLSSPNLIMHKYPKLKCELCNTNIPGK